MNFILENDLSNLFDLISLCLAVPQRLEVNDLGNSASIKDIKVTIYSLEESQTGQEPSDII